MEQDIKELLEIICEMGEEAEISDMAYIENIANKYGLTIDEELKVKLLS
ncbi:hypothetical protein [Anaeromicrobium sediminis]|nr:hypothetical protein [Anaeromicrobium sediminis]